MADQKDYEALFMEMHPGFFEKDYIRSIEEDWIYEEMILRLDEFDPDVYQKTFDSDVSFGIFQGSLEELHGHITLVFRLRLDG